MALPQVKIVWNVYGNSTASAITIIIQCNIAEVNLSELHDSDQYNKRSFQIYIYFPLHNVPSKNVLAPLALLGNASTVHLP